MGKLTRRTFLKLATAGAGLAVTCGRGFEPHATRLSDSAKATGPENHGCLVMLGASSWTPRSTYGALPPLCTG